MAGTGRVKPRAKSAAAPVVVQPKRSTVLDEGDRVEFSTTFEAKNGGRSFWVKVGASTQVRQGEDADEALDRITLFCTQNAEQTIRDLT